MAGRNLSRREVGGRATILTAAGAALLLVLAFRMPSTCGGGLRYTEVPPGISYTGGDGSSRADAVIIRAGSNGAGVHSEYVWVGMHYPGACPGAQALQMDDGHSYDVLYMTTAAGVPITIYFDITDFFPPFPSAQ